MSLHHLAIIHFSWSLRSPVCDFKDKVKYIPVWLVDFLFSGWQEHGVSSLYFVHSCSFLLGKQLTSGAELPLSDSDLGSTCRVQSSLPVPSSPQKLSLSEAFPRLHSSHLCFRALSLSAALRITSAKWQLPCPLPSQMSFHTKEDWVWWPY